MDTDTYEASFVKMVRLVSRIEGGFSKQDLVCRVEIEISGIPVCWDGFENRFEVMDGEKWCRWINPRKPELVCALANAIPELLAEAKIKTAHAKKVLSESRSSLEEFLLAGKDSSKGSVGQPLDQ